MRRNEGAALAQPWIQALLWGLLGGSALVIGAALAFVLRLSPRALAGMMAFGAGVLISALSFELVDEAHERGGLLWTALGLVIGACAFTLANIWITRQGGHHRKRSAAGMQQQVHEGAGAAIAAGALIDGIPESIAIGVSLLENTKFGVITVAAVFLSNLPEGLSSATGMRKAGRSSAFIFGVWGAIALACGLAAMFGNLALAGADSAWVALALAMAAGGILAMIVDTMIPEAFEYTHEYAGLITLLGFLAAFVLARFGGH
jgi:ZIP family zinc transporter